MGIIRFLLALGVLVSHSSPIFGLNFIGGVEAVESFYIISGFYMSIILNEKYVGKNNSYKLFISNRLLRLYPIYWVVLLLTIIYSLLVFKLGYPGKILFYSHFWYMQLSGLIYLIFSNIFILGQDIIFYLGLDPSGSFFFTKDFNKTDPALYNFLFVPQAWSISLEIIFYLMAPFIVRRSLYFLLAIYSASFLVKLFLFYQGLTNPPWNYQFFPAEVSYFILGAISYHIYRKVRQKPYSLLLTQTLFAVAVFCCIFYYILPVSPVTLFGYHFFLAMAIPFIFDYTKNNKIDRYIGELSYPMYISHMFILMFVSANVFPKYESLGTTTLILTIIFSVLLNEFVAKRVEIIRQSRLNKNTMYNIDTH
jgi:peptidoglycan/LPS O-acetylase OafA/YrhL